MVLERGMDVAHGGVAGVPSLGKEAKVRELQFPCDPAARCKQLPGPALHGPRVQHEQGKGHDVDDRQDEENRGFSYAGGLCQEYHPSEKACPKKRRSKRQEIVSQRRKGRKGNLEQ
jgi:hypothetical protein